MGQLGQLADQLNPGRPGSDHHKGQVLGLFRGVGGQLGHLEGAEDVAAQMAGVLEGLHPRRELSPLVVPEVGVRRPRWRRPACHRAGPAAGRPGPPQTRPGPAHRDPARRPAACGIRLLPDHVAQGRRDQPFGQDPGRYLVQQWLEQVVVGPVYDRHLDVSTGQAVRHVDAAETAADDNHPVPATRHPHLLPEEQHLVLQHHIPRRYRARLAISSGVSWMPAAPTSSPGGRGCRCRR